MEDKCYMCGNTSDFDLDLKDNGGNVLVHREICEECFMKLAEKISPDKILDAVFKNCSLN